jgi:hypothetical protein
LSRSAPPAARLRHKSRCSKKRSVGGKRSAQEKKLLPKNAQEKALKVLFVLRERRRVRHVAQEKGPLTLR